MTKTIKELLDEKFDSYHKRRMENRDCPCIEGCSQCEYRNTKMDEIISQVEALVREETLKDMRIFFATKDWHGTGKAMVEDYTKTKDITL